MSGRRNEAERFWEKVSGGDYRECWLWTAGKNRGGYGRFRGVDRQGMAHRWAYEAMVAPIPEGLDLDHLCRTPACINPWHLEPVTRKVNLARGVGDAVKRLAAVTRTHCANGHSRAEEAVWIGTQYRCRGCGRESKRRRRAAARAARAAA